MLKVKSKVLLYDEDEFILSQGRARILQLVHDTGSLAETARQMSMSYRHIWGIVRKMEDRSGTKLVESGRGGAKGGKTRLTERGLEVLEFYQINKDWLDKSAKYGRKPSLTVDGIVLIKGKMVLIKRKNPPYKGMWALPGGFVDYKEKTEDAVVREMLEETSLKVKVLGLLGVYSAPDRDPRGHTVSAVYVLEKVSGRPKAADDAAELKLFDLENLPEMAFDHKEIVMDFIAMKDEE